VPIVETALCVGREAGRRNNIPALVVVRWIEDDEEVTAAPIPPKEQGATVGRVSKVRPVVGLAHDFLEMILIDTAPLNLGANLFADDKRKSYADGHAPFTQISMDQS
jgi:hypothetical protein